MDIRPRKKQKTIIETDDDERDEDWIPEEEEGNQIHSPEHDKDKSLPDDSDFDSTDGFQLKVVKTVKQSNHLVWSMFGHLMKNNKIVDRVKNRIYCTKCFENKKFKP